MPIDYSTVTELAGARASRSQLERICNRYYFAAQFCDDKDVLEVACGAGQGLGYLAKRARRVVGVDIDTGILEQPKSTYRGRDNIEVLGADAEKLPFSDGSFDVVILYEAIYYLRRPERFANEARRILRPGGTLLVCTANKDLPDFNPSPYSFRYFAPTDFVALLEPLGFGVQILGESPVAQEGVRGRIVSAAKRLAVRYHLMPSTMRGKEIVKRLVFGRLVRLPSEIDESMAPRRPPTPLDPHSPARGHLVIHCVARLPGSRC